MGKAESMFLVILVLLSHLVFKDKNKVPVTGNVVKAELS